MGEVRGDLDLGNLDCDQTGMSAAPKGLVGIPELVLKDR